MGITIGNSIDEYNMGYISFGQFRMRIADKVDETFSALFKDFMFNGGGKQKLDKIFSYLNKNEEHTEKVLKINQEFINFLFASDCDGQIKQEDCQKILETLEKIDDNVEFGYSGTDDDKISINKFKEMLARNEEITWR